MSKYSSGLRWSLLLAIGAVPVACGGTTQRTKGDDEGTTAGRTSTGGSKNGGGTTTGKAGQTGMVGTGGKVAGGGGAGSLPTCTAPKRDTLSGLIVCAEGYAHRDEPMTCFGFGGGPAEDANGGESAGGAAGGAPPGPLPRAHGEDCTDDESTCEAFVDGYCDWFGEEGSCASGCFSDEDCGLGYLCRCGSSVSPTGGECVRTDCEADADCQPGYFCASYSAGCGDPGFACQTAMDQCTGNQDCDDAACGFGEAGPFRACDYSVCGRPFLVESVARWAPVVMSDTWTHAPSLAPRTDHLSSDERAALAQHWTRLGQMEHASIAAFARFQLQLLSLGAPPELVEDCTAALADETAHARLCFQIASVYAGHAIGPGPLAIEGSLEAVSLCGVVDLVIAEGCFGETTAALDALQAAEAVTDPVIHDTYIRIARDEERHAALAFRFLRWALGRDPVTIGARVLDARQRPPSHHRAVFEVVLPCLDALLQSTRVASHQELFV